MATVNKVEVGDGLRPTGGLSQMAATVQAQRTQNAALGYQQQQDAKIQPGAGKAWQQQQQEYAAVENNLVKARAATEAEAQQVRSMIARARRDGRRDIEAQLRSKLRDINVRQSQNEKALLKSQFIHDKLFQYLGANTATYQTDESGGTVTTSGPMYSRVHGALKQHMGTQAKLYADTGEIAKSALAFAMSSVHAAVDNAEVEGPLPRGGSLPFGVTPIGAAAGNKLSGMYDRATGVHDDKMSAARNEAIEQTEWVPAFAKAVGEGLSRGKQGKTVAITKGIDAMINGLYALTAMEDAGDKGLARQHAREVAKAISDLKGLGVTDVELDAIRDHIDGASMNAVTSMNLASSDAALQEGVDAKDAKRSPAKPSKEMIGVYNRMGRMASALDTLNEHFDEGEWRKEYGVTNYGKMVVSEDWMMNAIPEITASFIANNGELKEEQLRSLMNQFNQEDQEQIVKLLRTEYGKVDSLVRGAVKDKGYDDADLYGVDHKAIEQELLAERNRMLEELSDLQFQTEGEVSRIDDAAEDELMQYFEGKLDEVAAIEGQLEQLRVLSDPTMQAIAQTREQLGTKP